MDLFSSLPVLLDGATGSMLAARGMPSGSCSELWVLEHPDVLADIQHEYIAAGSQIIYAPTFGANSPSLARHGITGRTPEFNLQLAAISKEVAGEEAAVAGDLSPTGLQMEPFGSASFDEVVSVYHEQAEALEQAGVDLYVVETLMSLGEARAALLGIREVSSKPVMISFTCGRSGRNFAGGNLAAALITLQAMGASAFGVNCFDDFSVLRSLISSFAGYAVIPIIAKPNAGLPELVDGALVYNLSPSDFSREALALLGSGASLLGGCCGTTPEHIAALRSELPSSIPVRPRTESRGILSVSDRAIYPIVPDELRTAELKCSDDLMEDVQEAAENGCSAVRLILRSENDILSFASVQSMLDLPVILYSDNESFLERAVRVYSGIALYDSRDGLTPAVEVMQKKYGLQII